MNTQQQIDHKLAELKREWREHPERRSVIELKAKVLKMTPYEGGKLTVPEMTKQDIQEALKI